MVFLQHQLVISSCVLTIECWKKQFFLIGLYVGLIILFKTSSCKERVANTFVVEYSKDIGPQSCTALT
jgi:hypothetical protein